MKNHEDDMGDSSENGSGNSSGPVVLNRRLFLARALQATAAFATCGGIPLNRLIESVSAASPLNPITAPKLMNIHFWGGLDFFYCLNGVPLSMLNDSDCPGINKSRPDLGAGEPNCALTYDRIQDQYNFGPFGPQNAYTPRYRDAELVANPLRADAPFAPFMEPLKEFLDRMAVLQVNGSVHNIGNYLIHTGTHVTNMPAYPALVAKAMADRFGRTLPYHFVGGSYGARYGDPGSDTTLSAQPIQIGTGNFVGALNSIAEKPKHDLDPARRKVLENVLGMIERQTAREVNRASDKKLFGMYSAQYRNARSLITLGITAEVMRTADELIASTRGTLPANLHGHPSVSAHSQHFAFATVLFSHGYGSVYDYGAMGTGSDPHHEVKPHRDEIQVFMAAYAAFLRKLRSIPAGDGNLLDTVNFVLTSEMGRSPQIQSQIGEGTLGTQHYPHGCAVMMMGPNVKPGSYGGFKLPRRDTAFTKVGNLYPLPIDTAGRPSPDGRMPDLVDIYQTVLKMFGVSKYAAITPKGVTWDFLLR